MKPSCCKHLRTKSLYIGATPEEAFTEKEGDAVAPCHFWCNLTQTVVGMDDQEVHPEACIAGRVCFEE